ncbi:MAG: VWA domain-containing protein [Lachnospiraceae bacterium]|nr:VWA domain-containing protein [Lachnospiraceae bacterium]
MVLTRGMRDNLGHYVHPSGNITVSMIMDGSAVYDYCCFCFDANGKLCGKDYMIFYNQTMSPQHEITYEATDNGADFVLTLNRLPVNIHKLVFTVSIDGNGTMGSINSHNVLITQPGNPGLAICIPGSDFLQEKAIISFEIYRKDGWRINAVASGFNGGLEALLTSFGGSVGLASEISGASLHQTPSAPAGTGKIILAKTAEDLTREAMNKINLSKDVVNLEKHIVNLSKTVIDISKKVDVDLGSTKARVVVVLDYSGSMNCLYSDGTVQSTLNKLVPLGLTFSNNNQINVYLFQNDYMRLPEMSLDNYDNYVFDVVKRSGYRIGGTNYAPVLNAIVEDFNLDYTATGIGVYAASDYNVAGDPTFILFITDGENSLADKKVCDELLRRISTKNMFVQFIGIGDEDFDYLRRVDKLTGRARDNTGFAEMLDLNQASDEELYTTVLEEFSRWLKGLQ